MKNSLSKPKAFVQNHKTTLAAVTGVAVGASAIYFPFLHGRQLIEVTANTVNHLRENELAALYETAHGAVMLTVPKHP